MVPKARHIIPGTQVNIVLKSDQPTGRLTTGTVQNVLTKGDHPRGVKVRLTTGQIGRVQSLVSETAVASGERPRGGDNSYIAEDAFEVERCDEVRRAGGAEVWGVGGRRDDLRHGRGRNGPGRRGGRQSEDWNGPVGTQALGLDAFIVSGRQRGARRGGRLEGDLGQQGEAHNNEEVRQEIVAAVVEDLLVCPVCGGFTGDEPAVAHHVATHFDEATPEDGQDGGGVRLDAA